MINKSFSMIIFMLSFLCKLNADESLLRKITNLSNIEFNFISDEGVDLTSVFYTDEGIPMNESIGNISGTTSMYYRPGFYYYISNYYKQGHLCLSSVDGEYKLIITQEFFRIETKNGDVISSTPIGKGGWPPFIHFLIKENYEIKSSYGYNHTWNNDDLYFPKLREFLPYTVEDKNWDISSQNAIKNLGLYFPYSNQPVRNSILSSEPAGYSTKGTYIEAFIYIIPEELFFPERIQEEFVPVRMDGEWKNYFEGKYNYWLIFPAGDKPFAIPAEKMAAYSYSTLYDSDSGIHFYRVD